jgi:hypothetical protein
MCKQVFDDSDFLIKKMFSGKQWAGISQDMTKQLAGLH